MAQFRTTADLCDSALRTAGEVTSGTSAYETQVLDALNRVHYTLVCGGTIPLLKDSSVTIDEVWPWARSARPLILELQPKITAGSVSVTVNSEAGTFSSAPTVSVAGWYMRVAGASEVMRVGAHTASQTAFEFDAPFLGSTSGTATYELFKLDYDLLPEYIVVDSMNNKLQFQETAGTTLTATLTSGVYTPAQLATEVETQLNATGGTPVYTVSYSATTRKFTLASDRASSAVFVLVGTGDQSAYSVHKTLGFDDENTTNAASVVSTYPLGGLARIIEPMKIRKAAEDGSVYGVDPETFQRSYPLVIAEQGIPDRFTVLRESTDGVFTVRFNRYPAEKTRVEVEHTPIPRDLKDSSASIPLVPRKWVDVLEDAAVFYTMLAKNDDKMQVYANLVQSKLLAMVSQHRGSQVRFGKNFGQIVPRPEQMPPRGRGLLKRGGYTP